MLLASSAHHRILLADGDVEMATMLSDYLSMDMFNVTVVHDGLAATRMLASGGFDVTLLELMLPHVNGLELLRRYRRHSQQPVIMMSAHSSEADRVVGLENGADDYLTKPFGLRELKARIQTILRRFTGQPGADGELRFGPLCYRPSTGSIYWHGEAACLTGAEQRLLERLMRLPGQVVSRHDLAIYALGRIPSSYDRSIETHISNIRRKLRLDSPSAPVVLRNLRGRGYMLTAGHPG